MLIVLATRLNSILLPQLTDTLNIYPCPVYQVLNVNWSTFLKEILPTLLSLGWNNGTHIGCQLASGDLYFLPLTMWPTGVLLATVWVSWPLCGYHGHSCGVPNSGFCHLPPHLPLPYHPTAHYTHPLYYQY